MITGNVCSNTEDVALTLTNGTCIFRVDNTAGITLECRNGTVVALEESFIDGLGEVSGVTGVGCVCPAPGTGGACGLGK